MPELYVVGTPLGNLGDMSARALDTLRMVDFIAAEDTRVTMKLLQVFDIHTPLVSLHMHNEADKGRSLAERLIQRQEKAALVTDAGMPCISDPGYLFVRYCTEMGIPVLTVPGPSAGTAAVSVSGVDAREWLFCGFLPREKKSLEAKLRELPGRCRVAVVHESPYRILDLMETVVRTLPGCRVSLSCDLTKLHELTLRGRAEDVLETMRQNPKVEKGEYCLVMDFHEVDIPGEKTEENPEVEEELLLVRLMLQGMTLREAQENRIAAGGRKNAVKAAGIRVKELFS